MSRRALNLLQQLGLLRGHSPADLSCLNDYALSKALREYFIQRTNFVEEETKELTHSETMSALLSSFSARKEPIGILANALVQEHLIIDDPVYQHGAPKTKIGEVHREYIGIKAETGPDRSAVSAALRYFSELSHLIEAQVVTVLPLQLLHLPPENLPIYYSEDRFRSEIPDSIHEFIHKHAEINPVVLRRDTGELLVLNQSVAEPCRAIHIRFKEDFCSSGGPSLYMYQELAIDEVDKERGMMKARLSWEPDKPLDQHMFDAWVYQSINRTIIGRLRSITSESRLASSLGYSYITESRFEAQLLAQSGFRGEDTSASAINFLNANDALIEVPSAQALVRLRERNKQAFRRFRSSLLDIGDQLTGVPEHEFKLKAERLFWSEIQPQIDEIKSSARRVWTAAGKGTLLSLGGISLAVASGTDIPLFVASLYAAARALTETLPTVSEYLNKRKGPEYIWSRLAR